MGATEGDTVGYGEGFTVGAVGSTEGAYEGLLVGRVEGIALGTKLYVHRAG